MSNQILDLQNTNTDNYLILCYLAIYIAVDSHNC